MSWHKTLLEMAFGTNSQNIKIFRNDINIKEKLDDYLSFRHFIRHSYSSELDWNVMEPLVNEIDTIWQMVKTDFKSFTENN